MRTKIPGLLALGMISAPALAGASTLYAVEFSGVTPLYSVNQGTGALSVVGATGQDNIGDLTSDTRAGSPTLWGIRVASNELLSFNPGSGAVTGTVALDSPDKMVSIAFDPVTGLLYGNTSVGFGAPFDALYSIDPLTGATSFIGRILFQNVYALAFDQSGNLFGIADATNELISISTATGNGSFIADLALEFSFDIASRPEDDVMFLADSGTYTLFTLDTVTGATTSVGGYGSNTNVVGLAFLPDARIPEPGSLALLGLGLAGLGLSRRRKA